MNRWLTNWEEVAKHTGRHRDTVRRWHYRLLNLPFVRMGRSVNSRFQVHTSTVDLWILRIGEALKSIVSQVHPK